MYHDEKLLIAPLPFCGYHDLLRIKSINGIKSKRLLLFFLRLLTITMCIDYCVKNPFKMTTQFVEVREDFFL